MPVYTKTSPHTATERLARAALELHRLAMAASEIQHLPSPMAHRETTKRGAPDPTATTALDERRAAVADALTAVTNDAELLIGVEIYAMQRVLADALNQWDGKH